jgi:hypothetical protein
VSPPTGPIPALAAVLVVVVVDCSKTWEEGEEAERVEQENKGLSMRLALRCRRHYEPFRALPAAPTTATISSEVSGVHQALSTNTLAG